MSSSGQGPDAETIDGTVREIDRILKAADIRAAAVAAEAAARRFDGLQGSTGGSAGVGSSRPSERSESVLREGEDALARVESHVIDRQLSLLQGMRRLCAGSSDDPTLQIDLRDASSSGSQAQADAAASFGGRRRFAGLADASRLVVWAFLVLLAASILLVNT